MLYVRFVSDVILSAKGFRASYIQTQGMSVLRFIKTVTIPSVGYDAGVSF